ncbi:hypothetical protein HK096_005401, partial [Nowakowskiella sp. JEL0078]
RTSVCSAALLGVSSASQPNVSPTPALPPARHPHIALSTPFACGPPFPATESAAAAASTPEHVAPAAAFAS